MEGERAKVEGGRHSAFGVRLSGWHGRKAQSWKVEGIRFRCSAFVLQEYMNADCSLRISVFGVRHSVHS
ncbi:hypothetical protein D1AOALGA4SA_6071 [Olavius algarvensis Delta 1 endosymbiont]|nr:hypothetical protein D1AOALGA4SA_6071 [Olavius algarvensis Delta 1 endosymbiont]